MLIKLNNKVIGELVDNVFTKPVKKSKHFMRIYDAWGIDLEVFEKALEPPNSRIIINDSEEKRTYKTNALTYRVHGIVRDLGFRPQIFLSTKYFDNLQDKLL